ncbi:MAG TPA: hypothetical protein VM098_09440 [Phycisphaerae bacterium]|nr:hypothetical protein [Phycisphaerae bacterium]
MSGDTLNKVQPGDPLKIPAATFNSMIDAAAAHRARAHDVRQLPQPAVPHNTVLLVQNSSGADRDRGEVLGIDGVVISPTDNQDEFEQRFALDGATPTADHAGRFVVLAEPIPTGELGRAYVAGACPVRIDVQDEAHLYADVTDGDASKLTSGAFGSALILWAESGTGTKWAVVQLGGGLQQRGVLLSVLVWRDGGTTDGSKTAQCDRTYTAKSLDGSVTLGTGLAPKMKRRTYGQYVTPPTDGDGVEGLGYFESDVTFVLWDANEVPAVRTDCP